MELLLKRQGDGTVSFKDEGNEYIIKLDDEGEEDLEAPEAGEELPDEAGEELPDTSAEQNEPTDDQVVYEIELDDEEPQEFEVSEGENSPFDKKAGKVGKKLEAKESVSVQKSHTPKDGQPFDKSSPQTGVKKLQANEESFVA